MLLRLVPVIVALPIAGAVPPQAQEGEDGVFVDEIKKDFLDRIKKAQDAGDWRSLFEAYGVAVHKYQQKLVRPNPNQPVYIGVIEYLNREFSKLPADALEYYRLENNGRATMEYRKALETGDRQGIQAVVEKFFFASCVDEALDRLGNLYFEDRRNEQAIFYWRRLLEHYPDSKIPKHLTAGKIAVAARGAGNVAALEQVRGIVKSMKIDGEIVAGGRTMKLSQFLVSQVIVPPVSVSAAAKMPSVPEPEARFQRRLIGVRNDIKRWTYDFTENAGQPVGGRRPRPQPVPAPAVVEFPYFSAFDRVKGRDVLVITDGQRLVAVNPQKVTSTSPTAGVMWRFPREGAIKKQFGRMGMEYGTASCPFIGAVIEDGLVYATLFSEKRTIDKADPNRQDFFEGPQRLACFDAISGKLLWDTDDAKLQALLKKQEFFDRNWAFASPPLVRGDNLYIGLCTSPMGEPESRLVCIDRRSGELRWHTFLTSVTGGVGRFWGGGGRWVTYLTLMVEDGGILYAHSNLGVVAAVQAVSGNVLWLARYPRTGMQVNRWGEGGAQFIRPANAPVIHRGRLYCLPQDNYEMQVFSIADGSKIPFQLAPSSGTKELQWRNITQLVGLMEDWMALGGQDSYVVNMVDRLGSDGKVRTPAGKAYSLPRSNVYKCGKGLIDGETIYFPTSEDNIGALSIYHGIGSFKNLDQVKWQEVGEYGNLLVAGDYLVVTTATKAMVYTDVETIRKEFITRLSQSPPSPQAFLEHGDIMRQNERLVEAADSYLAFIDAAKGDPTWEKRSREVKQELYGIYLKRGQEALVSTEPTHHPQSIDFYRAAKGFSYDDATFAESTHRLAEAYEKVAGETADPAAKKELAKKAVEEYQQIVERSRDSYYKPENSDLVQKMWSYAAGRIRELGKQYGADVLEPVEKAARAEYDKMAQKGGDSMRRVIDLYPQTKAALDAYRKMGEDYVKAAEWRKVVATLREFKEKYPDQWTLDLQKTVTEALEKLGDWRRLWDELKKMGDQFGTQMIKVGEQEITIKALAEKKQAEIQDRLVQEMRTLADPAVKVHGIEGASSGGRFDVSAGASLLAIAGEAPPAFTADHELVVRGSTVELWDLKKKERLWTIVHPGGYVGIVYEDLKGGADPGVKVTEVQEGSPAEKGGLKDGDVILAVNGAAVNALTFDDIACAAVGTAKFQVQREKETVEVAVDRVAWPATAKPSVVGAAFTRDYGLVIAWEDLAACFDAATAKPYWTFRGLRDRFVLQRVGWSEGRVLLHEHYRGASRSPFRDLSQQYRQEQPMLAYDEAYARAIVLDDATGEVAWAKKLSFDPNQPQSHRVGFLKAPAPDKLAIWSEAYRDNLKQYEISILQIADGKALPGYKLTGNVISTALDVDRGLVYYIDANTRILKSVAYGGSQAPRLPDISLQRYMDPNYMMAGVAAGKDYVAVAVPPWQAATVQRVVIFSLKTGQEHTVLTLPDERSLPMQRPNLIAVADDGMLYVYNVPKSKLANPGGADRRAYLSAYRILTPEKADAPKVELVWDAPAPVVAAGNAIDAAILPMGPLTLFYSARGARPGDSNDGPIALVYGAKDGGYLRMELGDLAVTAPDVRPVTLQRGRLFVQTKAGLDIYGNE